jgi:hypothetical protein
MNLLKKLPLFFLSLLLLTACKKETKFDTTGSFTINFYDGIPACYSIDTESTYTTSLPPLYTSDGGRPADIKVKINGKSITFEGLNYGNYVFSCCPYGNVLMIQVVAGSNKEYTF